MCSIPIDHSPQVDDRRSASPLAVANSYRPARRAMQDECGRALFLTESIGGGADRSAFYRCGYYALGSSRAAFGGSRERGDCAGGMGSRCVDRQDESGRLAACFADRGPARHGPQIPQLLAASRGDVSRKGERDPAVIHDAGHGSGSGLGGDGRRRRFPRRRPA